VPGPLVAIVPANATSGSITVSGPDGSATSSKPFTVPTQPTVIAFDVAAGRPGSVVGIRGTDLDAVTSVALNGLPATFTRVSMGLTFTVPAGATSGPVTLQTPHGSITTQDIFIVEAEADPLAQWTWHGRLGERFNNVAYGNGLFVEVAENVDHLQIMTSPDGVRWTPRVPAAPSSWRGVAFGHGTFVVVGSQGAILTSTDGPSEDGLTWKARTSGTSFDLRAVAFGADSFVAVGDGGVILQSGFMNPGLRFSKFRVSSMAMELGLASEGPSTVVVETSTNLLDWVQIPVLRQPQDGTIAIKLNGPMQARCFYRAVLVR